jgi:hypothetical protein
MIGAPAATSKITRIDVVSVIKCTAYPRRPG